MMRLKETEKRTGIKSNESQGLTFAVYTRQIADTVEITLFSSRVTDSWDVNAVQ